MKKIMKATVLLAGAWLMQGCGLDNYDEPEAQFSGRVTYQGEPLQLRHGSIKFDLEQDSYELGDKIEVAIAQEGTFAARIFPGEYRFVPRPGNGPWIDDCQPVEFTIKGGKQLDFEVVPYYLLRNSNITLSGNTLNGVCSVKSIAGGKAIEAMTLFVGKTRFVDDRGGRSVVTSNFEQPAEGVNNISVNIKEIVDKYPVLYARIGLKIHGVDERIYTEIVKIK
ncbi:MAG: DUF3823 domain-containing protein [Alistipes sp.]|nr:DUF3823 domain-containing protein [Alistipes onderdonkii]MBS6992809.1 DUF3823 domain-containing protein [Alistipes sp.]